MLWFASRCAPIKPPVIGGGALDGDWMIRAYTALLLGGGAWGEEASLWAVGVAWRARAPWLRP